MIRQFTVSRDDSMYHAWPDLALTRSGRLVCVFTECRHHFDRGPTRFVYVTSDDRGRNWSSKRPLTEVLERKVNTDHVWNCPRVTALSDGRLVIVGDRVSGAAEGSESGEQSNWLWFSSDNGESWEGPHATPVSGIVPDQLIELKLGEHAGRWLLSAHTRRPVDGVPMNMQRCWWSDDCGQTWSGPAVVARAAELRLCEGSIMELPTGRLVCFLRENSGCGYDAYKALSVDGGQTWEEVIGFPLPGCHRPVAGMLASGRVMITYRFLQGPAAGQGWSTQNFFAALTDVQACLAPSRQLAHARIMPLDYDRSPVADLGYSGWVQFPDGEIYVVQYLVDDAPKGQIRGYSLRENCFYFSRPER